MKKMKKLFAVILSLAMILGMSVTALAEEGTISTDANGSSSDKVDVKITNLTGSPTVTLYQIAEGRYQGTGASAFIDYTWAEGLKDQVTTDPAKGFTADDITAIVNGINTGTIIPIKKYDEQTNVGATYTANVGAGAYIALITNANDDSVYNPILLTASYNANGQFIGGTIDAESRYLYGTNAVAKKTTPTMDKTIDTSTSDGAADKDIPDDENETKWTASVGDKIDYNVALTIPSYPANAVNQTLFLADKMSKGLTYLPATLTINVGKDKVTADANGSFVYSGKEIATVRTAENGFYLNFKYGNLISDANTGATYPVSVSYSAIVNDKAVVAPSANENDARMYYANEPSQGSTFEPTDDKPEPDEGNGIKKIEDKEKVYTYQLAFKKIDSQDDTKVLANAVFGIYEDEACEKLIDIVKTNEKGYAVSTSVGAGTYYVREIEAPEGYSLNDTVYPVTATWKTATTTITRKEETVKYTTEAKDAEQQPAVAVGYLLDGVFYNTKPGEGAQPAYILKRTVTETTTTEATTNPDTVGGTVLMTDITNTTLSQLPSTGGIGTTIFTIGGCVIMIAAAALFFASRKKSQK